MLTYIIRVSRLRDRLNVLFSVVYFFYSRRDSVFRNTVSFSESFRCKLVVIMLEWSSLQNTRLWFSNCCQCVRLSILNKNDSIFVGTWEVSKKIFYFLLVVRFFIHLLRIKIITNTLKKKIIDKRCLTFWMVVDNSTVLSIFLNYIKNSHLYFSQNLFCVWIISAQVRPVYYNAL